MLDGGNRTPIFYMLPKIHKNKQNPPGRPIVSSINGPTEKLSQLVDLVVQPYAQQGKSYIKDTPDFLEKITNLTLSEDEWLFALDVSNLYTNIPHAEGIDVVKKVIHNHTALPSNDKILSMLKMVLKCNCFRFDNEFYLQINGTAMGTRVAPTYAIIFMNNFESTYVYSYHQKPRIWYRFIDDIWGIFKGSETELLSFLNHLNAVHPTIKFTWDYSKTSVTFLDVTTYVKTGKVLTTLYVKPTDNHGYLDFSSCHPTHNKHSIPHSQFL